MSVVGLAPAVIALFGGGDQRLDGLADLQMCQLNLHIIEKHSSLSLWQGGKVFALKAAEARVEVDLTDRATRGDVIRPVRPWHRWQLKPSIKIINLYLLDHAE